MYIVFKEIFNNIQKYPVLVTEKNAYKLIFLLTLLNQNDIILITIFN